MQIPILNGIYTDGLSDYRTAYPKNLIPVPKSQGVSAGYLRPAEGIELFATTDDLDRGGINWNGVLYRVIGQYLCRVSSEGAITKIGSIPGSDVVRMDYSFDRLAVVADKKAYYYNGTNLTQIVDIDLGNVFDVVWVDGYFLFTDGKNIITTELSNPSSIDPFKYGSSEIDPDPIKGLLKIRNEPHVVNRYTIEAFDNVGGTGFPFQRIDGAQITAGAISKTCFCKHMDMVAFLGGAKNEPIGVWIGLNGSKSKISTREIDQIIEEYTEEQLLSCSLESRVLVGHSWLYIHLPDATYVHDYTASQTLGEQVWFKLCSSIFDETYLARNHVYCYNKWVVAHPTKNKLGVLTNEIGHHWGDPVTWEFSTQIMYNEGMGVMVHELELVCLPGRASSGDQPFVSTQYSTDGETWSHPFYVSSGKMGERNKRLVWFKQGLIHQTRIQKFSGTSNSRLSIARLDARFEPMVS